MLIQKIKVECVIKRGDYNDLTFENDIAILRLASEVTFNERVRPACLPTDKNEQYTNRIAVVSGKLNIHGNHTICMFRMGRDIIRSW